jgi:peptidoglycan/xylan/chitin deacetylase (PgdA/CDA1 family)
MYYAQENKLRTSAKLFSHNILRGIAAVLPFSSLKKLTDTSVFLPFYHLVSDCKVPHVNHLYQVKNIRTFEKELDFLLKHYQPIALEELIGISKSNNLPKKHLMHLSFDDGLKECYEIIAPILHKKGIPATFFLNSDFIDNKRLMFRYKISLCLDSISKNSNSDQTSILKNATSIFKNGQLKRADYTEDLLIDDFASRYLDLDFNHFLKTQQPFLNSDQIFSMIEQGFTFGSHSLDHPLYASICLEDQIKQTLESQKLIESNFNLDYRVFAFPFTDNAVTKQFFNEIFEKEKFDLSFGTAGLKKDSISRNLQRFPMEQKINRSVKIELGKEYLWSALRSFLNKNYIVRT